MAATFFALLDLAENAKAMPDVRRKGVRTPAVIVCSDRAHYACLTVANWLGLGEEQVVVSEEHRGRRDVGLERKRGDGSPRACLVDHGLSGKVQRWEALSVDPSEMLREAPAVKAERAHL